jgi:hypothetical protein
LTVLTPEGLSVSRKSALAAAMTASVSYRLGNRSAALLNSDKAHAIFTQLAQQTAQLERAAESYGQLARGVSYEALPMSIALVEAWYARALQLSGNLRASRTTWERMLETHESVLAADLSKYDAAVNRTVVTGTLGHVSARLGDTRAAQRFFHSTMIEAARLQLLQPDYLELDYVVAQASAGMGSVTRTKSNDWYQKSLNAWARVATPGRLTIAWFDLYARPAEVADRLRSCFEANKATESGHHRDAPSSTGLILKLRILRAEAEPQIQRSPPPSTGANAQSHHYSGRSARSEFGGIRRLRTNSRRRLDGGSSGRVGPHLVQ